MVKIANSIHNNKKLSKTASKALLEKFLTVAFTDEQRKKLSKKLQIKDRGTISAVSNKTMVLTDYLEELQESVSRFHFTLAPTVRYDNASGSFPRDTELGGYVYEVMNDDDITRVCIYLSDYKVALVVKLEEIQINFDFVPIPWSNRNPLKFELNGRVSDIDEWLDNYFSGQNGFKVKIDFKFYIKHLEEVKKAYLKYFKHEMVYEIKERKEEVPINDPDNPNATRELIVEDVYSSVIATYNAFKKWYMDYGFFQYVVVLNPAIYNDRLVGYLLDRFARRLNRYGGRYDIEINKTLKPEYAEKIRLREERIAKYRREHPEEDNQSK